MAMQITNRYPLPTPTPAGRRVGRKGDGRQETISRLKVGDSFDLECSASSACVLCWWAKARFPEREFTYRKEGDGVRIWRSK